jgi:GTPase SAR1 family protein
VFYHGSHAVILVYDVNSLASFENVREWKQEIENNIAPDILVYLVGNFADCPIDQRAVTKYDGEQMMQSLDLHNHMETSALDS